MKPGTLVRSVHDFSCHGLVSEVDPEETRPHHGRQCARVLWFDGEETIEFIKMLEVLSEGG